MFCFHIEILDRFPLSKKYQRKKTKHSHYRNKKKEKKKGFERAAHLYVTLAKGKLYKTCNLLSFSLALSLCTFVWGKRMLIFVQTNLSDSFISSTVIWPFVNSSLLTESVINCIWVSAKRGKCNYLRCSLFFELLIWSRSGTQFYTYNDRFLYISQTNLFFFFFYSGYCC